jgi:hypothetical protein
MSSPTETRLGVTNGNHRIAAAQIRSEATNHFFALAIYFMHYNYVRIHQALQVTPAMAAGVSKTLWTMEDVVKIVEEWEAARDGSGT